MLKSVKFDLIMLTFCYCISKSSSPYVCGHAVRVNCLCCFCLEVLCKEKGRPSGEDETGQLLLNHEITGVYYPFQLRHPLELLLLQYILFNKCIV